MPAMTTRNRMHCGRGRYIYQYCLALVATFKIDGWGGEEESLAAIGELLAKVTPKLARQSTGPPIFWPCAGRTFDPSSQEWARRCILQVKAALVGFVVVAAAKLTVAAYDELETVKLGATIINVVITLVAISGQLTLNGFLSKLVLPNRRDLVALRNRVGLFFLLWMGALQGLIFGQALGDDWDAHEPTVIAVEMLFMQLAMHKCYVGPQFVWSFPRKPLAKTLNAAGDAELQAKMDAGGVDEAFAAVIARLNIVVAAEDIPAAVDGTLEYVRADSAFFGQTQTAPMPI